MPLSMFLKFRKRKRGDAGPSACERVLCTYELVEKILQYLPSTELRSIVLVSPLWKNLIERSKTLRETKAQNDSKRLRTVRILLIGQGGAGKKWLQMQWLTGCCGDWSFLVHDHVPHRKLVHPEPGPGSSEQWLVEVDVARTPLSVSSTRDRDKKPSTASLETTHDYRKDYLLFQLLELKTRQADGVAFVYSVTQRGEFESIRRWWEMVQEVERKQIMAGVDTRNREKEQDRSQMSSDLDVGRTRKPRRLHRPLGLVATKRDVDGLLAGWEVTQAEGRALAAELGCGFFETSAMTGEGIDEAFSGMCMGHKEARIDVLLGKKMNDGRASTSSLSSGNNSVTGHSRESFGGIKHWLRSRCRSTL